MAVAGISFYQSRHAFLEEGVRAVEAGVSVALGVPVSVGKVEGPYWNGLTIRDVKIYGSRRKGAPVIAEAPRIRASYSIIEILRLGKRPVMVDVYQPRFMLSRSATGSLDYAPTFAAGPGGPAKLPNLPPIRVRVHDGSAAWRDQAMYRVADFKAEVRALSGQVDIVDKVLKFQASGREAPARLTAQGSVHLERLSGRVDAEVQALPTARWVNYLASSPDFLITGGAARVGARIQWESPETLQLAGDVQVANGSLNARGVRLPVQDIQARATFDLRQVVVSEASGAMAGNRFSATGKVLDLGKPAMRMRFTGGSPKVDVAALVPLVPDLANYGISGLAQGTAVVSGTTLHPVVDAKATMAEGRVLDQVATAVSADIHYEGLDVTLPRWQATLNGGTVTGRSGFTLEANPTLMTEARWAGVDVPATLARYLPDAPSVGGKLEGRVSVTGTTLKPVATGSVRVAGARYAAQDFSAAAASFAYADHRWRIPQGEVGLGEGALRFSAQGTETGVFAGRFDAHGLPLVALAPLGVEAPVTGAAAASGSFAGDWTRLAELRAKGEARIRSASIAEQPVERASANWAISGRQLTLSDVDAALADGTVTGSALIDLMAPSGKLPRLRADFAAKRLELARVEPLQAELVAQTGLLGGRVSATGSVETDGTAWRMQAEALGTGIDAARLGHVQRVSGPVYFGHQRLTFPELAIRLEQGVPVTMRGSLAFDRPVPAADLEVSVHDASAKDLMAAVHWEQLLRGTWIDRRFGEKEPEGPPTVVASLADDKVPSASGSIPLKELIAHWERRHLDPLSVGEEFVGAKLPFWQAVGGRFNLELAYQGLVTEPEVRVRARLKDGAVYGHRLRNANLTAVYRNQHLYVPVFDLFEDGEAGAALQARGVLGQDGTLAIYGSNLDLSWANPYLRAQELSLEGRGGFTLLAKGDLADPRFEVVAEVGSGAIRPSSGKPKEDAENRFTFNRADAKASYYRGRVTIEHSKIVKDGHEAHISGDLPLIPALSGNSLDVALDLKDESLAIVTALTRGEILWKGGPGSVTLKLGGTLEAPELSGDIDLRGVTIRERNLKNDITEIRALATISTKAISIERATARYGKGTLLATGQVMLKQFQPDRLRLQAIARQTHLEMTSGLYRGLVDASLEIGGAVRRPVIGGTVALSRGNVDLDAMMGAEGGASSAAAGPAVPVEIKDLNLRIHNGITVLGNKAVISVGDSRMFEAGIDGGLIVNGMLDAPQARGTINVRGGTFVPLNNPFDIVGGTIEFLGQGVNPDAETEGFEDLLPSLGIAQGSSKLPNARLNVVAKGQLYDYNPQDFPDPNGEQKNGAMLDVKVTVTGSLQNMERKFECTNFPGITQDRIEKVLGKEYLVTGIIGGGIKQAGKEDQTTAIVTNEVSGFLSTASRRFFNPVTSGLQNFLPLESFGFDLVSIANTSEKMAIFSGLGLSPSMYTETKPLFGGISLSGRYTFRTGGKNVYQAGLNYRFNDFLSLQAGVDNNDIQGSFDRDRVISGQANPSATLNWQRRF